MKRHLCLFIFLLSLLSIQAQNKVLMPTEIREANETEKVLLNAKNRRDCEDVTHYTNRLLELAGKDRDLLKNLDFVL